MYIFLGKRPEQRKYAPKVIEHLYLTFASIISIFSLICLYLVVQRNGYNLGNEDVFNFVNNTYTKLLMAILVIVYLASIINVIRIFRILKKTEGAKTFVYIEVFLSLSFFGLLILSPFSITSFKSNEIVYR